MAVSDYLVDKWLDTLTDPSVQSYVALFYATPPANDPRATELTGASYLRQRTFWTTTTRMVSNQSDLQWFGLPATGITHVGVFDGPYSNNLMFVMELAVPAVIPASGTYEVVAGELYLRFP